MPILIYYDIEHACIVMWYTKTVCIILNLYKKQKKIKNSETNTKAAIADSF